jgi:oligoribonuclease
MTRGFCFTDLETTGLDIDDDDILEVACIFTTFQLDELSSFHSYVDHPAIRTNIDPVVRQMHEDNGLFRQMREYQFRDENDPGILTNSLPSARVVDVQLYSWLSNLMSVYAIDHVEMAGAGIGQFDLQFCRRDFPQFSKLLHYRVFDVRSLKTIAEIIDANIPEILFEPKHRAMPDCKTELTYARNFTQPILDTQKFAETIAKSMEE